MARRILVALAGALAIVALLPDRLSGEPTTSSTAPVTPTTSPAMGQWRDLAQFPPAQPTPLRLYPRRAGAKYVDAEARPSGPITVGAVLRISRRKIEPRSQLPRGYHPADVGRYERLRLVDGYVPAVTRTTGDLLHVVVRVSASFFEEKLMCLAQAPDGSLLLPFAAARRRVAGSPTTTTSTTQPSPTVHEPFDVQLFFPLGARRGRIYITCVDGSAPLFDLAGILPVVRAVWGLDV